jgi:hypothetical protein
MDGMTNHATLVQRVLLENQVWDQIVILTEEWVSLCWISLQSGHIIYDDSQASNALHMSTYTSMFVGIHSYITRDQLKTSFNPHVIYAAGQSPTQVYLPVNPAVHPSHSLGISDLLQLRQCFHFSTNVPQQYSSAFFFCNLYSIHHTQVSFLKPTPCAHTSTLSYLIYIIPNSMCTVYRLPLSTV